MDQQTPEDTTTAEAEPMTSSITQRKVSSTDRSLVLSAIDSEVTHMKNTWKANNPNNPAKEQFYMQAMDATASSLKNQIIHMTTPVDDVEDTLVSFHSRRLALEQPPSDEDSSSSSSEEEAEISFDDTEVFDTEAHEKVKELRERSREIAGRVVATREEAVERALGVTGRSVQELLRVHGFLEEAGGEEEVERNTDDANANKRRMDPLNAALKNLTSSLQNVDSGLSEKLESLKERLGTIDSSVDKYRKISQGEENALSQTEKAMIAASNLRREVEVLEEDTSEDVNRDLARLFGGAF